MRNNSTLLSRAQLLGTFHGFNKTLSCPHLLWISLFFNCICQILHSLEVVFKISLESCSAKLTKFFIVWLSKSFILYQCWCSIYSEDAEVFPQPEVTDWAEASPDPDIVKETADE